MCCDESAMAVMSQRNATMSPQLGCYESAYGWYELAMGCDESAMAVLSQQHAAMSQWLGCYESAIWLV